MRTSQMSARIFVAASLVATLVGVSGCELTTYADDARRKGLQLYQQGAYSDAAGSFQNAVKQRATDYESFYYLGQTYEKLGQLQRAIQSYKSARDVRKETLKGIQDTYLGSKIIDSLASTIAQSADRDREIEILRQRASTNRNGEDLITIARVFKYAGDPDSALATFEEAVAKYPGEPAYAKEYGLYLGTVGLKDKARAVLTSSDRLRSDPEVQQALKGL